MYNSYKDRWTHIDTQLCLNTGTPQKKSLNRSNDVLLSIDRKNDNCNVYLIIYENSYMYFTVCLPITNL